MEHIPKIWVYDEKFNIGFLVQLLCRGCAISFRTTKITLVQSDKKIHKLYNFNAKYEKSRGYRIAGDFDCPNLGNEIKYEINDRLEMRNERTKLKRWNKQNCSENKKYEKYSGCGGLWLSQPCLGHTVEIVL